MDQQPGVAPIGARGLALDILDRVVGERRPPDEVFGGHPQLDQLAVRDRAHARLLVAMTLRRIGFRFAIALAGFALLPGGASGQQKSVREQLVGVWIPTAHGIENRTSGMKMRLFGWRPRTSMKRR